MTTRAGKLQEQLLKSQQQCFPRDREPGHRNREVLSELRRHSEKEMEVDCLGGTQRYCLNMKMLNSPVLSQNGKHCEM